MEFDYESMLKDAMVKVPEKSEYVKRFKMPQVLSETQGARTVVQNFSEIAGMLRRDQKHLAKYMYRELAMAGGTKGSQLILYGSVRTEDLQRKLESYVNEFVICKSCKNPDTKIIEEGRVQYLHCDACGSRSNVRSL